MLSIVGQFNVVSPQTFKETIEYMRGTHAFYNDNLSLYSDYSPFECRLMDDGLAGYALSPMHQDGEGRELINVFSAIKGKNVGDKVVKNAILHEENLRINCYRGPLVHFYGRHGFKIVTSAANFVQGKPDVVFMKRLFNI